MIRAWVSVFASSLSILTGRSSFRLALFLASFWCLVGRFGSYDMSSSSGSGQSLRCIVVTQILHLVGSHEVVVHATLEIALAQHATLVVVHSTVGAKAAQVRLHNVLALGIVVKRERAALGSAEAPSAGAQQQRASRNMGVRCGFCDDLTSAGSAEC
jgi:hypothetical protein